MNGKNTGFSNKYHSPITENKSFMYATNTYAAEEVKHGRDFSGIKGNIDKGKKDFMLSGLHSDEEHDKQKVVDNHKLKLTPSFESGKNETESNSNTDMLTCHLKIYERIGDENANGSIFMQNLNLDNETIDQVAHCNVAKSGVFRANVNENIVTVALPSLFSKDKVLTSKNHYGKFDSSLMKDLKRYLKSYNEVCVYVVKTNKIKVPGSKRKTSRYWHGELVCKNKLCKHKVDLEINHLETQLSMKFKGDICHDILDPVSNKISGKERDALKAEMPKKIQ